MIATLATSQNLNFKNKLENKKKREEKKERNN
jgi:hypothetical protein